MSNEEIMQKNNALSENELDGVSAGWELVIDSAAGIGSAAIKCPFCKSPLVSSTGKNSYVCLSCERDFSL